MAQRPQILRLMFTSWLVVLTHGQQFGSAEVGQRVQSINCIPILDCPEARKILDKPMTKAGQMFLETIKCGDDQRVWCTSFIHNKNNTKTESRNQFPLQAPDIFPKPVFEGGCGSSDSEDRVIGGEMTSLGEFPWMALLQYRLLSGEYVERCGGSLITDQYVLSAAHCILTNPQQLGVLEFVVLGEYDVRNASDCIYYPAILGGGSSCADDPLRMSIASTIVHPGYAESAKKLQYHHDIGLIRMANSVQYTTFIRPICLPASNENMGRNYTVAGWGKSEYSTSSGTPFLLKLSVPYFNTTECEQSLNVNLIEGQFCVGGVPGKESCSGDSGGPLMAVTKNFWTQMGIVSVGTKTCGLNKPTVYTKITTYLEWIYQNVKP